MKIEKLFDGVYRVDRKIATINLTPGKRVYGEELLSEGDVEYRLWNPYRSKLAAAILNGLEEFALKEDSNVLYIGAATGTTASHVSDIVKRGRVYCVELSERNMRGLIRVCEARPNMLPILADAGFPEVYQKMVGKCDIIYQDAAAREQAALINRNSGFLKGGGTAYLIIKSQSVDISKRPEEVFRSELAKLDGDFKVVEKVALEPYDELHLFSVLKKR